MHHHFIIHNKLIYSWKITLHIYSDKHSLVDRYMISNINNQYSFIFSENTEFKTQISNYLLNNNICEKGEIINNLFPFAYKMILTKETILSLL